MNEFSCVINCEMGLEEIVSKEVKEIVPDAKLTVKPFNLNGKVLVENVSELDLIKLCFFGRSFHRVLLLIDIFNIEKNISSDSKIVYERLANSSLYKFFSPETTFGVTSEKIGEGFNYTSIDIRKYAGDGIIENVVKNRGFKPKVFLDDPDILVRLELINNKCLVLLDLVGKRALYKRGWRVFHHPASIKPTTAYCLIRLAEWKASESLLDPFCGSGTIPIEAALYAREIPPGVFRRNDFLFCRISPFKNLYEKFFLKSLKDYKKAKKVKLNIYGCDMNSSYILGAKKNAVMAGVANDVRFLVENVKYLFFRFKNKKFDKIVTNPPYGIRMNVKNIQKVYYYLFDNALDVLEENGKMVIITIRKTLVTELAKEFGFSIENELIVFESKDTHFHILILT